MARAYGVEWTGTQCQSEHFLLTPFSSTYYVEKLVGIGILLL